MAVYVQLQETDIQTITGAYGLRVSRFEPIEAGASNSNYLLHTPQGRYILTIFEDANADYVAGLGELLLFLARYDFPTTRLLSPLNGGTKTVYNGKPVMVKTYIAGEVFQNPDEAMLRQVGAAMASLHQIPVPNFFPGRLPYGAEPFPAVVGAKIDPAYERWIAERLPALERRMPKNLPDGLIHGDIFFDNVLFEGARLTAIIDFECAIHHSLIFDVAMGIVGMGGNANHPLDGARALVDGYQQVRKLEDGEKEALQLFVEYAAATVSCWRFWKYHIDATIAEKADMHRPMAKIATEISAIPPATFSEIVFG